MDTVSDIIADIRAGRLRRLELLTPMAAQAIQPIITALRECRFPLRIILSMRDEEEMRPVLAAAAPFVESLRLFPGVGSEDSPPKLLPFPFMPHLESLIVTPVVSHYPGPARVELRHVVEELLSPHAGSLRHLVLRPLPLMDDDHALSGLGDVLRAMPRLESLAVFPYEPKARQGGGGMRDPLLPVENENSGAPTLTLRGTTLDLRAVLADLLAFGPAAASRWGMAAPALSPQELDAIREAAMRDAAAREMLAEEGWAGATEVFASEGRDSPNGPPPGFSEWTPMEARRGRSGTAAEQEENRETIPPSTGSQTRSRLLLLGLSAMVSGFALWVGSKG
jgi:hypothetical protein